MKVFAQRAEDGTLQHVSAMEVITPVKIAIAEADPYTEPGVWWVARVRVPDNVQSQGIGSRLLQALIAEVRDSGAKAIIVAPGGYNSDETKLARFYTRNGFREVEPGLYRMELLK